MHTTHIFRRIAFLAILALSALCFASAASALPTDPGDGGDAEAAAAEAEPRDRQRVDHRGDARQRLGHQLHGHEPRQCPGRRLPRRRPGRTARPCSRTPTRRACTAGASRSETIHILRTNCYIAVRFTADSGHVVAESSEFDNVRWATAPDIAVVPDAAEVHGEGRLVPCERRERRRLARLGRAVLGLQRRGDAGHRCARPSATPSVTSTPATRRTSTPARAACTSPASGGAAPVGMGFSVELWEHDLGQPQQTLANIAYAFHGLGGIIVGQGDELLARHRGQQDRRRPRLPRLDRRATTCSVRRPGRSAPRTSPRGLRPSAGASSDTRTYSDGDASYTMTAVVTRVG